MIDFTPLTDDQLVELVRAACAECGVRGMAVQEAARAAMLSEHEKAQIRADATAREAQRIREEEAARVAQAAADELRRKADEKARAERKAQEELRWKRNGLLARMVRATLGRGWVLTVWQKDGELRVYLDGPGRVEYYHTGNHRNAPGTLTSSEGGKAAEIREICRTALRFYNSVRLECTEDAAGQGEMEFPAEYAAALKTRQAAEAEAVAAMAREAEAKREREAQAKREREAQDERELAEMLGGEMILLSCQHREIEVRGVYSVRRDYRRIGIVRTASGLVAGLVRLEIRNVPGMRYQTEAWPAGFDVLSEPIDELVSAEEAAILAAEAATLRALTPRQVASTTNGAVTEVSRG